MTAPASAAPKLGRFPHQNYVASCSCKEGEPKEQTNYQGHVIAPPRCSLCGARYQLDVNRF